MRRAAVSILLLAIFALSSLSAQNCLLIGGRGEMMEQEWKFGSNNEYRSEEELYLGGLEVMASHGFSESSPFGWCWNFSVDFPIAGQHRVYDDEYGTKVESTRLPSQESPFAFELGVGLSARSDHFLFTLSPDLSVEFWGTGFPSFCLNLGLEGTANYIFDDDDLSYVVGLGVGYDPFQWLSAWRIRTGETTVQDDYHRFSVSIFTGILFD